MFLTSLRKRHYKLPHRLKSWLLRHTDLFAGNVMRFPTFDPGVHYQITLGEQDYCRLATLGLAIQTVHTEGIPGAFAEVGVYQGRTSRVVHMLAADRPYYLFDTFSGFPSQDLNAQTLETGRFDDTSIAFVSGVLGDTANVIFRPGYVPETLTGLEDESFAFVLLDLDIYKPTRDSLEFFYPRLSPGAYLFIHDYNSTEGEWACKRALTEFLADKPEKPVELSDVWGSVVFRKI
jgi:O-methyltransferase